MFIKSRSNIDLMTFIKSGHNIDPAITPIYAQRGVSDLIFLRDTGAWYDKEASGDNQNIPIAASRAVDDDLFVYVNSNFTEALAPAGWTQVQMFTVSGIVAAVQLFHRVATLTAADEFPMPVIVSTRNRIAQMAAFGNDIAGSPPDSLVQIQGGGLFTTAGKPLTYLTMTAGATPNETLVIFLASHFRLNNGNPPNAIVTPANTQIGTGFNLQIIGSHSTNDPSPSRNNATWSWDYHDTSVAVPGGTIAYTTQEFGANFSQYSRWNLK